MLRKWLLVLLTCSLITVAVVACSGKRDGGNNTGSGPATGNEANTVHMDNSNFVQSSITIKKGESLTLVSDTAVPHIIANGTWENGTPKQTREPGAPDVKNVQINGNGSGTIGPFTTAGTFKLYCTIHPGMSLTVTVQ